jgi:hypothetical protein
METTRITDKKIIVESDKEIFSHTLLDGSVLLSETPKKNVQFDEMLSEEKMNEIREEWKRNRIGGMNMECVISGCENDAVKKVQTYKDEDITLEGDKVAFCQDHLDEYEIETE